MMLRYVKHLYRLEKQRTFTRSVSEQKSRSRAAARHASISPPTCTCVRAHRPWRMPPTAQRARWRTFQHHNRGSDRGSTKTTAAARHTRSTCQDIRPSSYSDSGSHCWQIYGDPFLPSCPSHVRDAPAPERLPASFAERTAPDTSSTTSTK